MVNSLHHPLFYFMANSGQIIKSRTTENFTHLPNELCQSYDLTLSEKGMLVYLLSLPADWVIYRKNLYNTINGNKNEIDRAFKGLQEKGYVLSVRVHEEGTGKFIGWNHIVYNEPAVPKSDFTDIGNNRSRIKPKSDFTEVGESAPIQKKHFNTKETSLTKETLKTKEAEPLVFISSDWQGLWGEWTEYKKVEHRDGFKTTKSEQVAINKLVEMSGGDLTKAQEIVKQSIANRWKGLFTIKQNTNVTTKSNFDVYQERREQLFKAADEYDRQRGFRP